MAPTSGFFAPRVTLVDLMLFSRQMYTLMKAGVPILPGSDGPLETEDKALKAAKDKGVRAAGVESVDERDVCEHHFFSVVDAMRRQGLEVFRKER